MKFKDLKSSVTSIDLFTRCPKCFSPRIKLISGEHRKFYNLICENDHEWTHFPIKSKRLKYG